MTLWQSASCLIIWCHMTPWQSTSCLIIWCHTTPRQSSSHLMSWDILLEFLPFVHSYESRLLWVKFSGSLNFLGRQFSGESKTKQQIHQNLQSKLFVRVRGLTENGWGGLLCELSPLWSQGGIVGTFGQCTAPPSKVSYLNHLHVKRNLHIL